MNKPVIKSSPQLGQQRTIDNSDEAVTGSFEYAATTCDFSESVPQEEDKRTLAC